jgi:hypothetical protein
MTKGKLCKASRDALQSFDDAAKSWGWHQDEGNGTAVDRSETAYNLTRQRLEQRLLYLENRWHRWRQVVALANKD